MILSVVLPVFNGESFLKAAIESILNQTFKDFEFIIINDGSTDSSLDIINSYDDERIIVVSQVNKGLSATLNIGVNLAKGKYIARMDADDIALPDRLEKQLDYLVKHPEIKLLGTAVNIMNFEGKLINIDIPYSGSSFISKYLFNVGNLFKHPTVVFEKEIVLRLGGYNEMIGKYFEDYFLWAQISKHYKVDILKVPLLNYRISPSSIMSSVNTSDLSEFRLKVVNKGTFTTEDLKELNNIVSKFIQTDEEKLKAYNRRIETTKKSRISRCYVFLKRFLGEEIAMNVMCAVKRFRGYFLILRY